MIMLKWWFLVVVGMLMLNSMYIVVVEVKCYIMVESSE